MGDAICFALLLLLLHLYLLLSFSFEHVFGVCVFFLQGLIGRVKRGSVFGVLLGLLGKGYRINNLQFILDSYFIIWFCSVLFSGVNKHLKGVKL